ncbi:hypothetical protein Glove_264g31 [Diversispora epigaea]|uniref:Uncharacterized protein n=1 Tax=Diversispora epigaea TaxID=1348612 RepID=A0A397I9J1_9GLOM|nr:hypothetical protein Glove_264g31 [Diversispora epigaea]
MVRKNKKSTICERCGSEIASPQMLRVHLKQKNPCPLRNPALQLTQEHGSIFPEIFDTENELEIFPVPIDNNARKSNETSWQWVNRLRKKYKEITGENYYQPKTLAECKRLYDNLILIDPNAFSDIPEQLEMENTPISENDVEAGSGPQTQAHRKGKLTELKEIVIQQPILPEIMQLQPIQLTGTKHQKFLDLDKEVPWPVRSPDEEHY